MESARGECGEKISYFFIPPFDSSFMLLLADSKHLSFLIGLKSEEQRSTRAAYRKSDTLYAAL